MPWASLPHSDALAPALARKQQGTRVASAKAVVLPGKCYRWRRGGRWAGIKERRESASEPSAVESRPTKEGTKEL